MCCLQQFPRCLRYSKVPQPREGMKMQRTQPVTGNDVMVLSCVIMGGVTTLCMLVVAIMSVQMSIHIEGGMTALADMSTKSRSMMEMMEPSLDSFPSNYDKAMRVLNLTHVVAENMFHAGSSANLQNASWVTVFENALAMEMHARSISENVDMVTSVAKDPRVQATDWPGLVANASTIVEWFEQSGMLQDVDSLTRHWDAFFSRMLGPEGQTTPL